jgi:hypothetical protein
MQTLSTDWTDLKTEQVHCAKRDQLQRCFQWKLQFRRFRHIHASTEYQRRLAQRRLVDLSEISMNYANAINSASI